MKRTRVVRGLVNLPEVLKKLLPGNDGWNPVFVYEDELTRHWARGVHERVCRLSESRVSATWWRLGDLFEPGVLAGAVSKAIRSELIVVAVHSGGGLPLPFYTWVNHWLPYRAPGSTALVALLANSWQPTPRPTPFHRHLQAIAKRGRMDLVLEERSNGHFDPVQSLINNFQPVLAN